MAKKSVAPNWRRQVDTLSKFDYEIFELAKTNVNYFTDYYMRQPTSGTRYYRVDPYEDHNRERIWQLLYKGWKDAKMPDKVFVYQDVTYNVLKGDDEDPIFWLPHGFLFQDWQRLYHHDPRPEKTLIGGFGVGKTKLIAISLAVMAATIPGFRGYAVAPQLLQAMEVYRTINEVCQNTLWWNRWVWRSPMRPVPMFELKSDYIGTSTIEILSIETDPEKVRTLEGDVIFLDQAEKIVELDDLIRDLGSRLRGMTNGRPRLGILNIVANAGDNPQLWMRYDMAKHEPETYLSMNPRSSDNPYLSKKDLKNMYRRVGGNAQAAEQWMNGERPMGNGKHFSQAIVSASIDRNLNDSMDRMLEKQTKLQEQNKPIDVWTAGFVQIKTREAGIVRWEMPPDEGRSYVVIADPGQNTPPKRDSAVIGVWDVTDFPEKPAVMRAFHWVNGREESYWPFLLEYERYVKLYKAEGRNAFDSTGVQKGFDELVFTTMGLMPEGMNMTQASKYFALNSLKLFLGKGLMRFPYISHMVNQLTSYDLPDNKIPQDIVMMLAMSAAYIRRFFYLDANNENNAFEMPDNIDRYERSYGDRYTRGRYET
jgi:hypothetical protein